MTTSLLLSKKKTAETKIMRLTVLMGGVSSERTVSLATGRAVKSFLDRTKYNVRTVTMDKEGQWRKKITPSSADVVFNALHGRVGEDGQLQGYLDVIGVPYTGSGVLASAMGMDKFICRQILMAAGLDVPAGTLLDKMPETLANIELPAVVKPNSGGSSLGVSLAETREALTRAVRKTLKEHGPVLIEPLIRGRELTVPILGNGQPRALPVIEIIPRGSKFFDYRNKYKKDGATEETPAHISEIFTQRAQTIALKAHQAIACRGYSRTDMILTPNGQIKVLEINTLPGLTDASLVPKSAAAAGLTFPRLLDQIVALALE